MKTKIFTKAEFNLLFEALNTHATEAHTAYYEAGIGSKRKVESTLMAVKKLEDKLNTL